jgi:hypothetical protein
MYPGLPIGLGSCAGLQPFAGKQVTGVPVPGHGLKPAFGRGHIFASRSRLSFINRLSRSVIAQRVRGRYSRLVQNDSGEPGLAARNFMADGIGCRASPPIPWVGGHDQEGKRLN